MPREFRLIRSISSLGDFSGLQAILGGLETGVGSFEQRECSASAPDLADPRR